MKKLIIAVLVVAATLAPAMTVFAEDTIIRMVNIGMSGSEASGEVYESYPVCYATDNYSTAYTSTSSYEIDESSTKYSRSFENWKAGEPVTVQVTVAAKDGYRFDKQSTIVNAFGNNVKLEDKNITGKKVKLRLKYWPSLVLPCIDAATVSLDDRNEYKLNWDAVEVNGGKWKYYEVRVMNDDAGSKSVMTKKVSTNSIDLSDMLSGGSSIIAIRTVGGTMARERYTANSKWVVLGDDYQTSDANVQGTFSGTGDKMVYLDQNGNMISGWVNINNCWYYFDPNNKNRAVAGKFALIDGSWYYFADNGVMKLGWIQVDGYWYHMHEIIDGNEGKMETGWVSRGPNGPYYYMNDGSIAGLPLGAMATNTVTPDGHNVDDTGKRVD